MRSEQEGNVPIETLWSQLSHVDTLVKCGHNFTWGHNYYMWSQMLYKVTFATHGHNCQM